MNQDDFVYPPFNPRCPPFGATNSGSMEYPCRKKESFKDFFASIDEKYSGESKDLPVGTVLYRGTLFETLYNPTNTEPVFFGLDVIISLWILCENHYTELRKNKNDPMLKGYLHVFEVKKPIPYRYIKTLDGTPLEEKECIGDQAQACVHPQVILHTGIGLNDHVELGTEVTLPLRYVNDTYLKYKTTHIVDVQELIKNKDKSYVQWNPTKSIRCTKQMPDILNIKRGGGKKTPTLEKIKWKDSKLRIIYLGPKGGKYVKIKGKYVRVSSLYL